MKWKLKDNIEPQGSSEGFWYDITLGGYITPEKILADDKQLEKLHEALNIVESFEKALIDNGLLNEF